MPQNASARIVIAGGGVIGLGIAYHLAKLGIADVLLVERHQLTSGTSWHAAGIVGTLRPSLNLTKLSLYATELFPPLEEETGQSTGFRRTGGLWLAANEDRLTEIRRIAAMGDLVDVTARILEPEEVAERVPLMQTGDLAGALWVEEDGQASPVDLCMAYAKGARDGGVRIAENTAIRSVETANGAVRGITLSTGEVIACEAFVNCCGAWAPLLSSGAGVPIPVQAVEHMYVVTEPVADLPQPFPVTRDLDNRIYIKEDAGKLVIGGFEQNAKIWDPGGADGDRPFIEFPEDWDQFEPFMEAGLRRMPVLESAGIQHFMNGPESFTPDTRQAMGESPFLKGYFVAAGFNSIGMMSSAGVGKAMAEWIVGGEAPMDLWEVDVARFDPKSASKAYMASRVEEAVAAQYDMHWPYKQMKTGRDLRRSPLHDGLAEAGAVFGATASWERPLWFAENGAESRLDYSFSEQHWWPAARREAEAVRDRVALIELSPFTKIDISGPDALRLLQHLCANDVDVPAGRTVYTQMLNGRGGIEADITVTRRAEDTFRVVSGAATRWKDMAWLARGQALLGTSATVTDVTDNEAVLGVMGPRAPALLRTLNAGEVNDEAFPFGASREIEVAGAALHATRVSFVGEAGFELYVPNNAAPKVFETLRQAGRSLELGNCGHYALDACRLEKGYRHWGHDMGPDDTPLEAGLAFAVAWDKPSGFLGRDALARQRDKGIKRRLVLFAVKNAHPLLLHDEPVYRDGVPVGLTTSGALGFRTDLSLCFAYVPVEPGAARSAVFERRYQVSVAGELFDLTPLQRPPYDPSGARMREIGA